MKHFLEKRTKQYELWRQCNNKCTFCYLTQQDIIETPTAVKIASLNRVLKDLERLDYNVYNCIGFIGGEFFQGQINDEVAPHFDRVFDKVAQLYNTRKIEQVWIPATLTMKQTKYIYDVLDKFDDVDNVWIITSWDSIGRFKTPKMEQTWYDNVSCLRARYPHLRINVSMILTNDLIVKYIQNQISFQSFTEQYGCNLFLKQSVPFTRGIEAPTLEEHIKDKEECEILLPGFFPKRKNFLKFLAKFKRQESEDMWNRLFNVNYRADDLIVTFNDGSILEEHRVKTQTGNENERCASLRCGHIISYSCYIDSNECVLCDKQKMELI